MTQIAALPTLNVYVAFDPTLGGNSLNTANQVNFTTSYLGTPYWTNITIYVEDFTTSSGKQHFLDRVESSTLKMTLNNRNGYFNGTPKLLNVRMPIAVTATWTPSGGTATTYPIFWGAVDSIREQVTDQLNSQLLVDATDMSKFLSLKFMTSNTFWESYVRTSNTAAWFRANTISTATITGATATYTGGYYVITYTAVNVFKAGQLVTITGLSTASGTGSFNVGPAAIDSATSTSFVVKTTFPAVTGTSQGTGHAYIANIYDQITGASEGKYQGVVSFPNAGAIIYSSNGCVDLGNGGVNQVTGSVTTGSGEFNITTFPSGWKGMDFWILGNAIAGQTILTPTVFVSGSPSIYTLKMFVQSTGELSCIVYNGSTALGNAKISGVYLNDGYWHHIGLVSLPNGYLELYADGVFASGAAGLQSFGLFTFDPGSYLAIGHNDITFDSNTLSAQIDEVVLSNNTNVATLSDEVKLRFKAGILLQQGYPVNNVSIWSGDRIAEILCISGYGSVQLVSGTPTVVLPTWTNSYGQTVGLLNIATAYQTYTPYLYGSTNGTYKVEPYYWDAPVSNSSALALIQQITDTDIGSFFQSPNGAFYFNPQYYYGTWVWNGPSGTGLGTIPYSGTWYPGTFTPTGNYVWTDDDTGVPYYGPSLQVTRDDVDTWTTVKVIPQAGNEQVYTNTGTIPGTSSTYEQLYGYSVLSKSSTLQTSLDAALSSANFMGYIFRSPIPRIQSVELRSETSNGVYIPALIGTNFSDVVRFKRKMPNASGAGIINELAVVESISHDFQADPGTWHTTFILDPYPVRS